MAWDVMVFNFDGKPPSFDKMRAGTLKFVPLGSAAEVRAAISRALPGVDWTDPTWGIYDGDGFSIEISNGLDDGMSTIMLHVHGGGEPIAAMLSFAVPNRWSLLDCTTEKFLDPENPSQAGWEEFQAFRDKVIRSVQPPGSD